MPTYTLLFIVWAEHPEKRRHNIVTIDDIFERWHTYTTFLEIALSL